MSAVALSADVAAAPSTTAARLLWLNGPFGVGKTTAGLLLQARTTTRLFDPEHLGVALGELLPAALDDADGDLPLWRSTVVHVGTELAHTDGTLVVLPATVYRSDHIQEMIDRFHRGGTQVAHVVLVAEAATIAARIHRGSRPDPVKHWCLAHVQPALAGLAEVAHHLRIDTTGRTPCQVADRLARTLEGWGWLRAG